MVKYILESKTFPALPNFHKGTGTFSDHAHVVDPTSVNQNVASPLKFKFASFKITVMSMEIATREAPNWFGVSFRQGLNAFDTVNIFCHPYPGHAGMKDEDYGARTGAWPQLFRYAQNFARQMDIAQSNVITVIPFFNNASYSSTGIFGPNWKDIIEEILALARVGASIGRFALPPDGPARTAHTLVESVEYSAASQVRGRPAPVDMSGFLRHVILSDFSHGRVLMWAVRQQCHGIDRFLREVWDFDGVHAATPTSPRAIIYNQSNSPTAPTPTTFHVPGSRWQEYHHKILHHDQLHGDLPAMLACHAATISRLG